MELLKKGAELKSLNKFKEAIKSYDEAIRMNLSNDKKVNINAYFNTALCLDLLLEYEKAIDCYNEVIKLDQNNTLAVYNKVICYRNMKRNEKASECMKELKLINDRK